MNIPNKLTLGRLISVPFCIAAVLIPESWISPYLSALIAAVIFSLASITDMIDGKIARKYNLITDLGKFIDPLADKFMVIGTMLAIVFRYESIRHWYFWVVLVVIFREFAVTSLRLVVSRKSDVDMAANMLGKIKTTMQITNILCVLLEPVIYYAIFVLILKKPEVPGFLVKFPPLTLISSGLTVLYTVWSLIKYIGVYGKHIKQ